MRVVVITELTIDVCRRLQHSLAYDYLMLAITASPVIFFQFASCTDDFSSRPRF